MAEFCSKCWNKMNNTDKPECEYFMSIGLDLCEGCGKLKHVVIAERGTDYNLFLFIHDIVYGFVRCRRFVVSLFKR